MATGEALEKELEARDPDVRLMLQVRDDVPGAFETLVERYQHRLVGVLTHLVGNPGEAEDLAQEVFLRIYRARKGYRPRAKFSTWLFTIANNLALNHLRSKGRNPAGPFGGCLRLARRSGRRRTWSPAGKARPRPRCARSSSPTSSARRSRVLGEDQKLAVLLNKFEDMSYAEIAEVMGRSEAAIKSLLRGPA